MERLKYLKKAWVKQPLMTRLCVLSFLLLMFSVEIRNMLRDSEGNQRRVLVAKRDLKAGLVLTVHDLTVTLTSKKGSIDTLSFSDQDLHQVLGNRLISDVPSGSVLLKANLEPQRPLRFSKKVPKGLRGYLIKTPSRLPLEPGDRVDLVKGKVGQQQSNQSLLEDKKVLALRKQEDHLEVLLALSPSDIKHLESFSQDGWVDLVLRNPFDETKQEKEPKVKVREKQKSILILEEG